MIRRHQSGTDKQVARPAGPAPPASLDDVSAANLSRPAHRTSSSTWASASRRRRSRAGQYMPCSISRAPSTFNDARAARLATCFTHHHEMTIPAPHPPLDSAGAASSTGKSALPILLSASPRRSVSVEGMHASGSSYCLSNSSVRCGCLGAEKRPFRPEQAGRGAGGDAVRFAGALKTCMCATVVVQVRTSGFWGLITQNTDNDV